LPRGWYFFGVSVSAGCQSVILAIDNSNGGTPQIYWMDQSAKGFSKNVTGKLDRELLGLEPSYGYRETEVWLLIPTDETEIELSQDIVALSGGFSYEPVP